MKITEILTPEMILPDLKATDKPSVLRELAAQLSLQIPGVGEQALIDVLSERESLGSTAIGDGIAIPHGKLRGVDRIIGVVGRSIGGVDFDSLDGNPTHIFFLLVAPEDSASLHLKALARVSRLFKDPNFREHLIKATDAADIFRLIKEEDARY
jgi:PTS system nitrogen regulatory IIA component